MSVLDIDDVKKFLRVTWTDDDVLIQLLIDSVEQWSEEYCDISLTEQTVTDEFNTASKYYIIPSVLPITAITAVYNADDLTTDLSSDMYLKNQYMIGYKNRFSEFEVDGEQYSIDYTGGYATLPAGLQLALFQIIARVWENRAGKKSEDSGDAYRVEYQDFLGSDPDMYLSTYKARWI